MRGFVQSELTRSYGNRRRSLIVSYGRWYKYIGNLFRLIKPRAAHAAILNPLDCHSGAARLQADNVPGIEGLHSHSSIVDESHKRDSVSQNNITLVARAEDFHDEREPFLGIGDIVELNSGSPRMLVVDFSDHEIVTAWHGGDGAAHEETFPRQCCHRVTPL